MKKISDVFEAQPTSIADFMRERGQGFYIPAYQRPYSWDRGHIERLFDDAGHGVMQLLERDDSMTFIGTLITIHDIDYVTVDPVVRSEVPGKVMTVIDGQQRLTTLLLVNTALHNEIRVRSGTFQDKDDAAETWLHRRCVETLSELFDTLEEDMSHGDGDFRWYPRMTRAYVDRWSRNEGEAMYGSPIGNFLHRYGTHTRATPDRPFRNDVDGVLRRRWDLVRQTVRRAVGQGKHDEIEFPRTEELASSDQLARTLFNDVLPAGVIAALRDPAQERFIELCRLLVFARFVLHRVAVTVVVARAEDYAFDMFESLNTTGEPLTAFETFRPRVISSEGHATYEHSPSHMSMSHVERYLEVFTTAQGRQRATNDLLIPFALAESGQRLSKRLNEQRRFLKDRYDALLLDEQRTFVLHLAHTTLLVQHAWNKDTMAETGPSLPGVPSLTSQCQMCFDVLRAASHNIVIGPLTRFYSAKREGDEADIERAVRAVTAFFAIWRAAKGGTGGIDDRYRDLMARGAPEADVSPLARRIDRPGEDPLIASVPSADDLIAYFTHCLAKDGLDSKETWVEKAALTPVAEHNRALTRLLLLAAIHDTVADPDNPGLVKEARKGVLDLLNYERWSDEMNVTVEHIAPQNRGDVGAWRESLYRDPELKDRLGNLILLPNPRNASVSNKAWPYKRAVYRVLSARSPDEAEGALEEAKKAGLELPTDLLEREEYLPLAAGVATYAADWDIDIVERRSKLLASLAWDRLAPWLGL